MHCEVRNGWNDAFYWLLAERRNETHGRWSFGGNFLRQVLTGVTSFCYEAFEWTYFSFRSSWSTVASRVQRVKRMVVTSALPGKWYIPKSKFTCLQLIKCYKNTRVLSVKPLQRRKSFRFYALDWHRKAFFNIYPNRIISVTSNIFLRSQFSLVVRNWT